jgi:hypothetical protein
MSEDSRNDTMDEIRKGLRALEDAADSAIQRLPPGEVEVLPTRMTLSSGKEQDKVDFTLRNRRVDIASIRELSRSGNREGLLDLLSSTIESLEQDKQNSYEISNRILKGGNYSLDPFTLAALAKFVENAGGSSKEIVRVVKMIADLSIQWTAVDMRVKLDEEGSGYAEYSTERDPLENPDES